VNRAEVVGIFVALAARSDEMPSQLIDTPEALDAAIAANRALRRERLARAVGIQAIGTRMAFGLSGCVALFSSIAFAAGDREAAAIIAVMAFITIVFTFIAGKAGRNKAVDALRDIDRSISG
jgi:hypothetical protein